MPHGAPGYLDTPNLPDFLKSGGLNTDETMKALEAKNELTPEQADAMEEKGMTRSEFFALPWESQAPDLDLGNLGSDRSIQMRNENLSDAPVPSNEDVNQPGSGGGSAGDYELGDPAGDLAAEVMAETTTDGEEAKATDESDDDTLPLLGITSEEAEEFISVGSSDDEAGTIWDAAKQMTGLDNEVDQAQETFEAGTNGSDSDESESGLLDSIPFVPEETEEQAQDAFETGTNGSEPGETPEGMPDIVPRWIPSTDDVGARGAAVLAAVVVGAVAVVGVMLDG